MNDYGDIDWRIHTKQNKIKDIECIIRGHQDAIIKREKELASKKRVLEKLIAKKTKEEGIKEEKERQNEIAIQRQHENRPIYSKEE